MSIYSIFAAELVSSAGALARRKYYSTRYRTSKKSGGEPVTDVDQEIEQLIIENIAQKYPQHSVLGEESGARGDQKECWVIDPIDGTTNYINQYPQCSVSVAFYEKGRVVAGAVHDIVANETFVAAAGEGAFLHNRRMRVSSKTVFSDSLFILSGVLDEQMWELLPLLTKKTAGFRRGGSTALDLAYIAAGRADMLVCGPVRFWDVAAGALLLREAGGLLTDINDSTNFAFGAPTKSFIAGAPHIFSSYRRTFQSLSP
ncbi:MAG: inositol monophosphatase family protein [Gammaproteobacteria bacterium WSBS_2016_MAG_OTU1]